MTYRGNIVTFDPMIEGLYDTKNPVELGNHTPECYNARFFPTHVEKRSGMSSVHDAVAAGKTGIGGWYFTTAAGAGRNIVVDEDGVIYGDDTGAWVARTGSVTLSVTSSSRVHFCTFDDKIVGTDNATTPFRWDGSSDSAAVLTGTPPARAKYMATFANRLLAINFTENGGVTVRNDGIAYSAINDLNSWGASDFLRIQQAGGKPITGVGYKTDSLLIFFENNVFELTDSGNELIPFQASLYTAGLGLKAGYAVFSRNGRVIGWTARGPVDFSNPDPVYLGEKIRQTVADVDYSNAELFAAVVSQKNETVRFCVRNNDSTENDLIMVLNPQTGVWSRDNGYAIEAGWEALNSAGQWVAYGISTDRVYEFDTGQEDATPSTNATASIVFDIWTPWYDFRGRVDGQGPMTHKIWQEFQLLYREETDGNFDLGYQLALLPGERVTESVAMIGRENALIWDDGIWGVDIWGGSGDAPAESRLFLDGSSTHIRFRIVNDDDKDVTLLGHTVAFKGTGSL